MEILYAPVLVVWSGLIVAVTRGMFLRARGPLGPVLVQIERDWPLFLPIVAAVSFIGGMSLAFWETVRIRAPGGFFDTYWPMAIVSTMLGAIAFSAHAHLPRKLEEALRNQVRAVPLRWRIRAWWQRMKRKPKTEAEPEYIPIRRRPRVGVLPETKGPAESEAESESVPIHRRPSEDPLPEAERTPEDKPRPDLAGVGPGVGALAGKSATEPET